MPKESEIHAHVPEEQAHLFTAKCCSATEDEYLDLLYSLVRVQKPLLCLETGTHTGNGARKIAEALDANNRGVLTTLEKSGNVPGWTPHDRVTVLLRDSLEYLNEYIGPKFEFVFLDSHIPSRPEELKLLLRRKLLADSALIAIHDTSPLRTLPGGKRDPESAAYRTALEALEDFGFDGCLTAFEFPYSRGLTLFRFEEE